MCSWLINNTREMCIRAVNTCYFLFHSVSSQYMSQEMCDKAVDDHAHSLEFVPDQFNTQQICHKIVSENDFMLKYLKYCHDSYENPEICDKVRDEFLPRLKFVLDWFLSSSMIKKLYTTF